jgi:hypothetical protein
VVSRQSRSTDVLPQPAGAIMRTSLAAKLSVSRSSSACRTTAPGRAIGEDATDAMTAGRVASSGPTAAGSGPASIADRSSVGIAAILKSSSVDQYYSLRTPIGSVAMHVLYDAPPALNGVTGQYQDELSMLSSSGFYDLAVRLPCFDGPGDESSGHLPVGFVVAVS